MKDSERVEAVGKALYGERWQSPLARESGIALALMHGISKGAQPSEKVKAKVRATCIREAAEVMKQAELRLRVLRTTEESFRPSAAA